MSAPKLREIAHYMRAHLLAFAQTAICASIFAAAAHATWMRLESSVHKQACIYSMESDNARSN